MPLLAATNLRHSYGTDIILSGVSLSVEPGQRVGVVGRNGQGKSTLMKCLGGLIKPDGGDVSAARGARVGYLHQDPVLDPKDTLRGAAEGAFAELHEAHERLNRVFDAMGSAEGDELDGLLKQQVKLEERIEALGGYAIDHQIDEVLHGVGFVDAQFGIPVSGLSGGQKARLALARLLLEAPDVLLLDEPTNHLDIDGRLWLESFLRDEFKGAVLLISHDRAMLDNVVNRIVEVENGRLIDYPGNYQKFRELRAERRMVQLRAWEAEQTRFKKEEEFIRKYKAGQRAKQAKGRQSILEREKESSTLERPVELATFTLDLPKSERSGELVIVAKGITKRYRNERGEEKVLFRDLDWTVSRGERWGIIGPNGAGKTTLVHCVLGETPVDAGDRKLGANVVVGHFKQTSDGMDPEMPVYRYLQKVIQQEVAGQLLSEQQARNLAGAFLFSGDEQDKELGVLSGGERARARMAALLASAKNLIILDEPTNHLDIPSAERLEESLALEIEATSERPGRAGGDYDGTMILISHDRMLINACCDHLLILDGEGGAEIFHGNYDEWSRVKSKRESESAARSEAERAAREEEEKKRRAAEEAKRAAAGAASKAKGGGGPKASTLERMSQEKLESEIARIEGRITAIDAEMGDPAVWSDHRRAERLGAERSGLVRELEPLEFEWMRRAEG
ncbi:MAG: ABC-F family ATP-binding cassette domain-containing protein [Phycisphaerales bacterium]